MCENSYFLEITIIIKIDHAYFQTKRGLYTLIKRIKN